MAGRGREITAINVLDHPAYSTDLASRDFSLFLSSRNIWLARSFTKTKR
jgi:hypothetical protein